MIHKSPFQLIPQYTVKRRAITIGKEQLAEIIYRLSHTNECLLREVGIRLADIPTASTIQTLKLGERGERVETVRIDISKKRRHIEREFRHGNVYQEKTKDP
jgi:hypothetical protein